VAKKSFKKAVLLKMETTYGVDPVPTGAADAVLIRSATITPLDLVTEDRTLVRLYFGAFEKIIVGQTVKLEYELEMVASGTLGAAPQVGTSLRVCGFSQSIAAGVSVTYAPISVNFEAGAFYYNSDGHLHKILGARGSVKLTLKPGGVPTMQFSMLGIYAGITEVALPAQTFQAIKPVASNNANTTNFVLHAYAAILADLSLDVGTQPTYRNLVGAGAERIDLEGHSVTGQITIELPNLSSKDFFAISKAGTLGALTVTHGTVAGSKVKIDAPFVQLTNLQEPDANGDVHLTMDMTCVPGSAGNDHLTITML